MPTISEILAAKNAAALSDPAPADSSPAALSFFDNAFSRDPSRTIDLAALIERVRAGDLVDPVTKLRATLATGSRLQYDEAKRSLPAVMLSGRSITRRADAPAEDRAIYHSGWLQGDFDGKDHPHLIDEETTDPTERVKPLMDLVRADPHVQAAFISPSGEGVKAIIRIAPDTELHRDSFEAAAEHFAQFGLKIDPATKDPGRLCFVSSDPEAWIRTKPAKMIQAQKRASQRGEYQELDTTAEDIREMLKAIPPRPSYDEWLRIASAVWSVLDEHAGVKLLNEWSPEEKPGEYQRKFKHRLREVRIGTLAWYAQAHGFDVKAAAKRKMWCGRIRFADGCHDVAEAPENADGPAKFTTCKGEEDIDNAEFMSWCFEHQQRGDAELWRAMATGRLLYDHYAKSWKRWNGSAWARDDHDLVQIEFIDSLTIEYKKSIARIQQGKFADPAKGSGKDPRDKEIAAIESRISKLNHRSWMKAGIEIAQAHPKLATVASKFDRSPYLLALENGVLDFEAGEFREAHPSDMLTHKAGVSFDPDATCPKFDAFLKRMLVDDEVIAFVLRAMAYSLTGLTDEDTLFFLYGKGANGKSTFMLVFKLLLGELMVTIDIETLLARRADANLDYKKATLEGRRVAMTDEVPENRKLGESMVKSLIGGDDIVARRPYEKPYSFSPTHKLWMVGNHKPVIEGSDAGIWRRICLIPWTQTIPVEERKPRAQIIGEMRQELPGILNRLIVAWQDFKELGGLRPPLAVQEATNEYRGEQDQFGLFLEERTEARADSMVRGPDLLKAYLAWCEDNGEHALYSTSRRLLAVIKERGFTTHLGHKKTTVIDGLELNGAE